MGAARLHRVGLVISTVSQPPPQQPSPAAEHEGYVELVRKAILKRWKAISDHEETARGGKDAEALHAMRVGSRRLRMALRVFRPYLPGKRAKRAARRIRRITQALGAPREWDVHAQLLARLHGAARRPEEKAALEHVCEFVETRRAEEREKMLRALDRCDAPALDAKITELAKRAAPHRLSDDPVEAAWAALEPLIADAFHNLPRIREREKPEELHRMRIAVKRLRYAIELLKPTFASDHDELLAAAVSLQETLGRYNDHTLLEDLLARKQARLREHGRRTLADGLTGPLDELTAERHECYAEFRTLTTTLTTEGFGRRVRAGLALDAPGGG